MSERERTPVFCLFRVYGTTASMYVYIPTQRMMSASRYSITLSLPVASPANVRAVVPSLRGCPINRVVAAALCLSAFDPQAVCSTSNDKAVTNLVKTLMGKERLERIKIFAGDVVEKKKPNPDIYNLAKVCGCSEFLCTHRRDGVAVFVPTCFDACFRRQEDLVTGTLQAPTLVGTCQA